MENVWTDEKSTKDMICRLYNVDSIKLIPSPLNGEVLNEDKFIEKNIFSYRLFLYGIRFW